LYFAGRATALAPHDGLSLRALALAHFRLKNLEAADAALAAAKHEGVEFDPMLAIVEALVSHGLGRDEAAHAAYEQVVRWQEQTRQTNPDLNSLRREAAQALGLPDIGAAGSSGKPEPDSTKRAPASKAG
jgi:hypothetical protein